MLQAAGEVDTFSKTQQDTRRRAIMNSFPALEFKRLNACRTRPADFFFHEI
jgi:hypothetical protein